MSQEPLALHPEAEQEYRDAYSWYRSEASPLPKGSKTRSSARYTRSNNRQTAGRYPIRAFANTRPHQTPRSLSFGVQLRYCRREKLNFAGVLARRVSKPKKPWMLGVP